MTSDDEAISTLSFRTVFWVIVGVTVLTLIARMAAGLTLASPTEQQQETLVWLERVFSGGFGGILGLFAGKRLT